MELSKRLYAVAGLVTEGASVADIGTDHGYVPIYLVENGIAAKVIALDVNQGPLEPGQDAYRGPRAGRQDRDPALRRPCQGSARERWIR